jgi:hypothetical protein
VFLLFFFAILIIRNKRDPISILHDIVIIRFTAISGISYDIIWQRKEILCNSVQERDKGSRIRRIRKHIISKGILPLGCHLYIVAGFKLAILHIVVFHAHERGILIRFGVAVSITKDGHVILVFLRSRNEIAKIFPILFWLFTRYTQFFSFRHIVTCVNFSVIFLNFIVQSFNDLRHLIDGQTFRIFSFNGRDNLFIQ